MDAQEKILRACTHTDHQRAETRMGAGETLLVCADCWNASVYARRAERKRQLAEHWRAYAQQQAEAMSLAGAHIGQRVKYFCRSMLGLGGITVTGIVVSNRNGIAVIRLDRLVDGKRQTAWSKGWTPLGEVKP